MEKTKLYITFKETKQEPLRLSAALTGFFLPDTDEAHRAEYLLYLKRRIRPAMERLIEEEAIENMQILEELGCFQEKELELFLEMARSKQKMISLMWLLQLKTEKYTFHDRDFSL